MKVFDYEVIKNVPYSAIVFVPPYFFHQSTFFKITYIESGEAEVEFYSRKRKKNLIKKLTIGDAFVVSPQDVHKYNVNEKAGKYRHRDIYVSPEVMKCCCDFISHDLFDEITQNEYPCFFKISTTEIIVLGEKLSFFINKKLNDDLTKIHKGMVVSLLESYFGSKVEKRIYPEWIQDLLRNLNKIEYIKQPIEVIVDKIGFSHGFVSRQFKKYIGVPLKQYVTDVKLNFSAAMLVYSGLSIENISLSLGFDYSTSFTKVFRKKYGTSPSLYRKELQNKQTSIPFVDWGTTSSDI